MANFELLVNGQRRPLAVDPASPLLFVLRNDLGLKAAKYGCGVEQCGACTVLVGGEAVLACGLPVGQVGEREVTTLEGLGEERHMSALQRAFASERAAQCGYCVPGIIVAAAALLAWNDDPDEAEIRRALAGNLCRCGAHTRMLAAIRRAARETRGERGDASPRWTTVEVPLAEDPTPSGISTSRSLQITPQLDAWIRFEREGRVTVGTGKVELGQGLTTALAMIAAEELDVSLDCIDVRTADTADGPNEFITAGSGSMEQSGVALRLAAADARARLLAEASRKLGVPVSDLEVEEGVIRARGVEAAITYWQLQEGRRFEGDVAETTPKAATRHRIVGRPAARKEMGALVTRGAAFVHDLERPGMVHGRIVRPPRYEAQLDAVDEGPVRALPGVLEVVRDGRFLAVVAEREDQAVAAGEALRESAHWSGGELAFGEGELFERLTTNPRRSLPVIEGSAREGPVPPIREPASATQTLRARYCRPYHMHAAIGPSAAVAEWVDERLTVWCHSQGVHLLRPSLARALGLEPAAIRVVHVPGAGCYGHNGADDAAMDAAVLALAVPGRPVRVQWSREDEHTWEPYGSAMVIELQASLDDTGRVSDWNHDAFSDTHMGRPLPSQEYSGLLASWHRDPPLSPPPKQPRTGFQVGIHRNADPIYTFRKRRVAKHLVDGLPLRVSSARGLGAFANVFAIESFMDELALAARSDPVTFRIAHLEDERARAVIRAAVDLAGERKNEDGWGRGLGFARYENVKAYAAIVADLRVDARGGIQLERFSIAADAGEIVDPDGLANQLEGGAIQAASWTLVERVRFERKGIVSRDWETYPILGFQQVPAIETVLLDRPGAPFLGAGEAAQGPTPAAIANAIFDAAGVRLRELPFTPQRVNATRDA